MQQPRRDQDHVVLLDRHAGDGVRPGGRARDQERRRIEPHGLVDHRAGEFQPLDIERAVRRSRPAPRPPAAPAWPDRAPADRATRTARSRWSRGRRGSWSRPRSPSCSSVKACAGLGIARGAHQVEQVARRRAVVLAGGAALGHQHADETRSSACGSGRGKNPAGSASSAAAPGRGNAAAPAARHIPSRNRATPRRGGPSRTRTWCGRRSRASSAASPRADRPARCWRPCSFAIVSSVAADHVRNQRRRPRAA